MVQWGGRETECAVATIIKIFITNVKNIFSYLMIQKELYKAKAATEQAEDPFQEYISMSNKKAEGPWGQYWL